MINLSNILVILSIIALVIVCSISRRATFRIAVSITTSLVIYIPVMYLCRHAINNWLIGGDYSFLDAYLLTEEQKFYFARGLFLFLVLIGVIIIFFILTSLLVKRESLFNNTKKKHSVVYFALKLYNWAIVTTIIVPLLVVLNYLMQLELGYLSGLFEIILKIGGAA
jgi:hypothetical protein